MSSQIASGHTPGPPYFLETECCGPGCSDPKAGTRRLLLGPAGFTGAHRPLPLASWKPHLPLSGPGDVVLLLRLIWIREGERSEDHRQRPQD